MSIVPSDSFLRRPTGQSVLSQPLPVDAGFVYDPDPPTIVGDGNLSLSFTDDLIKPPGVNVSLRIVYLWVWNSYPDEVQNAISISNAWGSLLGNFGSDIKGRPRSYSPVICWYAHLFSGSMSVTINFSSPIHVSHARATLAATN